MANTKTAGFVLAIILGAATIASTTAAAIGWNEARKAERIDQEIKDWKKTEYAPFKADYDTLKGQILESLRNLGEGQKDLKSLLQDHMKSQR